ncbi:MAG: hypothetical protein LBM61_06620 [Prevotellaceae bacterium]|jgi:hypothetical protein|nr:hypothetical protein [Prevotellaceae bacterium]
MKKVFLFSLIAWTFTLAGCRQEPIVWNDGEISQTVYADQTNGATGISFNTTGAWTSAIESEGDWISISPDHGDSRGGQFVQLTLRKNYSGADRSAVITILCEGTPFIIDVLQLATNKGGELLPKVDVGTNDPTQTLYANETKGRVIQLTVANTWTATVSTEPLGMEKPDWLFVTPENGDSEGTFTLQPRLRPNYTGEQRTAYINITCEDQHVSIPFIQEATDAGGNVPILSIDRTVLVYIMGDNSLSRFAQNDLNQMMEGVKTVDTEHNNLIVYFDNGSKAELYRLYNDLDGTVVREILETYAADRNSCGLTELKEVFSYVDINFPAEKYALELWSHGEGWLPSPATARAATRWIGQDVGAGTFLSISDLNIALDELPKLDYLFFDACFMQAIEVAYELRDRADYFIGSPTEIPGPGANYEVTVPAMFAKTDAGRAVAESYYDYYASIYDSGKNLSNDNWTAGASVSLIDAAYLEALASLTATVVAEAVQGGATYKTSSILDYDRRTGSSYIGYYDFDGLMQQLLVGNSARYTEWRAAFDAALPYAQTTEMNYSAFGKLFSMEGFAGVSIYLPGKSTANNDVFYQQTQWYADAGWSLLYPN